LKIVTGCLPTVPLSFEMAGGWTRFEIEMAGRRL
jgi:hypothetical protein